MAVDLLCRLFVDGASVTDRENPDDPACPINGVNDAKPPHPVSPQPPQLSDQWVTRPWIRTEGSKGMLDATLQAGR